MVLPELSQVKTLKHVAIAWDGGRAAARAVADALPFLQQASEIRVLTVTGEKPLEEQEAGERLAQGLRRRGLATAQASSIIAEDCPIATTIQRHAVDAAGGPARHGGLRSLKSARFRSRRRDQRGTRKPPPAGSFVTLNEAQRSPSERRAVRFFVEVLSSCKRLWRNGGRCGTRRRQHSPASAAGRLFPDARNL